MTIFQKCLDVYGNTIDPALADAGAVDNFSGDSPLIKFKQKISDKIGDNGTKGVKIMVSLKYFSNFWRTLEIPLINCKINLTLSWSASWFIYNAAANLATKLAITDTKFNVSVVIVST